MNATAAAQPRMSSTATGPSLDDAAWPRRFYAWMQERFPLANGLLIAVIFVAALLGGRHAAGLPPRLHAFDVAGFAAAWCFFLMLRIFDEHKDYALDCTLYPERVLQRGLITLGQLKAVGALAVTTQLIVSLLADGGFGAATLRWLVTFAYSLLMLKEFFVGEWLGRRLVLYAVSHMVVTPLAILWMAQLGAGHAPLSAGAYAYAGLSFALGFCFELARKMKSPSEERPGVVTYTSLFGVGAMARTVSLLWIVTAAGTAAVVWLDGSPIAPTWLAVAALALALPPVMLLARFATAPTPKSAKAATNIVGIMMLVVNVLIIVSRLQAVRS